MKRVLVTGAAGFIGSHFVDRLLLEPGVESVVGYDLMTYAGREENLQNAQEDKRFRLVKGDVRDAENLRLVLSAEGIDTVCHFAAETHVDRSILGGRVFIETNVLGTYTVLETAKAAGVKRLLHVSTDEVFGSIEEPLLVAEDAPLSPSSPYAASKASAELIVHSYVQTHGLPALIVRGSNNFGPRQFPEKLIPFMVSRILAGDALPVYGDGKQRRDWIWVSDFAAGCLLALQKGKTGESYNLGAGNERTNLEVLKMLCLHLDYPTEKIQFVADRLAHDRRYAMDSDKANRELGFTARRDFQQALAQTVDWYKANQSWVDRVQRESADYFEKNYAGR